jgi:hypothetical protein
MLLRYDKNTDAVQNLGALFDQSSPYHWSTGEGWYFSATQPSKLYTFLVGGTQLRPLRHLHASVRFDAGNRSRGVPAAVRLSVEARLSDAAAVERRRQRPFGIGAEQQLAAHRLRRVAAVRVSVLRTRRRHGVRRVPHRQVRPLADSADESQQRHAASIASSISETGKQTTIDGTDGALGHLDTGYGYAVGADNYNSLPNATILLKFPVQSTKRPIRAGRPLQQAVGHRGANHIAPRQRHAAPAESQYACGSNASTTPDMADEIVCFFVECQPETDGRSTCSSSAR